jgi:ribonuclease P protein component
MRREQRLKRRQEFSSVYEDGEAFAQGPLVIRVRGTREGGDQSQVRFGFAVGRRLGNAVRRNRVKRQLREAARRSGAEGNADIVVIARASAARASYGQLEQTLWTLLSRAGLRETPTNSAGLS